MSDILDLDQIKDAPVKAKINDKIVDFRAPGIIELAELLEMFKGVDPKNPEKSNFSSEQMRTVIDMVKKWVIGEDKDFMETLNIRQFMALIQHITDQVGGAQAGVKGLAPVVEDGKKKSHSETSSQD